jgi:tRNA 2-thiouridine synthesizing protein A
VGLALRADARFHSSMTQMPDDRADPHAILVDARGLNCPLPLLEARRAMQLAPPGAVLVVLATDPAAPSDFADFAMARDFELEETTDPDGVFRLTLRQGGSGS